MPHEADQTRAAVVVHHLLRTVPELPHDRRELPREARPPRAVVLPGLHRHAASDNRGETTMNTATLSSHTADAIRLLNIKFKHTPDCHGADLYDLRPTTGRHAGGAVIRCHGCTRHLVVYASNLKRADQLAAAEQVAAQAAAQHRGMVMHCPDCGSYRRTANPRPQRARCGRCHKAAGSTS